MIQTANCCLGFSLYLDWIGYHTEKTALSTDIIRWIVLRKKHDFIYVRQVSQDHKEACFKDLDNLVLLNNKSLSIGFWTVFHLVNVAFFKSLEHQLLAKFVHGP